MQKKIKWIRQKQKERYNLKKQKLKKMIKKNNWEAINNNDDKKANERKNKICIFSFSLCGDEIDAQDPKFIFSKI